MTDCEMNGSKWNQSRYFESQIAVISEEIGKVGVVVEEEG